MLSILILANNTVHKLTEKSIIDCYWLAKINNNNYWCCSCLINNTRHAFLVKHFIIHLLSPGGMECSSHSCIWTVGEIYNIWKTITIMYATYKLSSCEKKAWKNSGLNGIWTHDLSAIGNWYRLLSIIGLSIDYAWVNCGEPTTTT